MEFLRQGESELYEDDLEERKRIGMELRAILLSEVDGGIEDPDVYASRIGDPSFPSTRVCSLSYVCSWQRGTRSSRLPFIVRISISTSTVFPPTDSDLSSPSLCLHPVAVSSDSPLHRLWPDPSRVNGILERSISAPCVTQRDFASCLYSRII